MLLAYVLELVTAFCWVFRVGGVPLFVRSRSIGFLIGVMHVSVSIFVMEFARGVFSIIDLSLGKSAC